MIVVRQNDDSYEISFKYDPNLVQIVKNVPGRRWSPENKQWTISKDKLGFFLNQIKGTVYESEVKIFSDEDLGVNETLDATPDIPDIDVSKIPFYVKPGSKPYKHQIDFMKFSINRQIKGNRFGFILADDPGLAKTIQSANLAIYNKKQYGFKHCLVICCINSSKFNWKNDISDHTSGIYDPYILGTRMKKNGKFRYDTGSKEKYDDLCSLNDKEFPYFLIINVEAIRYKSGRQYPIADKLIELINSGIINMVIVDEVHKNLSMTSMQGKQLLRIKQKTGVNAEWIPMSGTPITKNPTDVFLPLKLVNGHNFNSYYKWCQEFCVYGGYGGYEVIGYKNIPRLKAMLQGNMLRRLREDVLDLPPKIRYTEYVENTPYQSNLYDQISDELRQDKSEIMMSLNPMTKFLRLRQVNGNPELVDTTIHVEDKDYLKKNAKLSRLLELIEEIVERGEKVVVFSNWVESLRTLYKFISVRYKTCCFTGTMKQDAREKHKKVFQENPDYKIMLGTIGALGTTHTLTAATNVIFYEEPWNPSDKEQAEDRIYRIGTTSSVNIYTLICSNTVDERVHNILYKKEGISKYIVDNKLDLKKNPELFDLLLSDSKSGGNKIENNIW